MRRVFLVLAAALGAFALDLAADTPERLRWNGIWRDDALGLGLEMAA